MRKKERVRLRALTAEEAAGLQRLLRAASTPQRLATRSEIVWLAHERRSEATIARWARVTPPTVRLWVERFNAHGLAGLKDAPRSGRPRTYSAEQAGDVIALSLIDPRSLGLPFASWTLDRLTAYLHEARGIPIQRTRVDELLLAEGLRWRQQETWFGERVDPAFAAKRGRSSRSTRRHLRVV